MKHRLRGLLDYISYLFFTREDPLNPCHPRSIYEPLAFRNAIF